MKRTINQRTGSIGQHLVKLTIEKSGCWIARDQNEDYGIDLEMELALEQVTGNIIKVQVKSHEFVNPEKDFVHERLNKAFLRYVYECRIPVLLVIVSVSSNEIWYIWLQKWLHDTGKIYLLYDELSAQSIDVTVHRDSYLELALRSDIISIATWENETQKIITLHDLAKLSLRLYDNDLADLLFTYIEKLNKENIFDYPDLIIDRVLELGASIWATDEGNKRSKQLYDFMRKNGFKLKREHISKLVLRGEVYSRTGIIALGVLYTTYPELARSLLLPELFKDFSDPRPHYYCVLRERYLYNKGYFWIGSGDDFRVGDFTIENPDVLDRLKDKMANRGDSAILDYLEYSKHPVDSIYAVVYFAITFAL